MAEMSTYIVEGYFTTEEATEAKGFLRYAAENPRDAIRKARVEGLNLEAEVSLNKVNENLSVRDFEIVNDRGNGNFDVVPLRREVNRVLRY